MSIPVRLLFIALISVITCILAQYQNRIRLSKLALFFLTAAYVCLLLSITLIGRDPLPVKTAQWIPGYAYRHIFDYPWFYAQDGGEIAGLGNVIMFIPFGMMIVVCIRLKHPYFISGLAALIASTCIEITQYYTQMGSFEVDDIIHNTWGALIGCSLILVIYRKDKDISSIIRTLMPLVSYLGFFGIISIITVYMIFI